LYNKGLPSDTAATIQDIPGHTGLPVYVLNNLTALPIASRFEINKALRRLYRARVEADYVTAAVVDRAAAKRSVRDLGRVLQLLDLEHSGGG